MSCDMKACFDKHAGEDGKLSIRELPGMFRDMMEKKGLKPQDLKCQMGGQNPMQMFREWDTDGDRHLSWEEFQEGPMKKFQEMGECGK